MSYRVVSGALALLCASSSHGAVEAYLGGQVGYGASNIGSKYRFDLSRYYKYPRSSHEFHMTGDGLCGGGGA